LCLKIAREPKAAQDAFEHVVQLDPSLGEAWFELALIQQDQGHLEEAVRNYRQALAARPDLAEAAVNLGICLQNTGDLSAAKRAYASALELRADTFGRIAQALSSAPIGEVWLDHQALRRSLGG
jgi:tetratricopeptide (TPR) repeat protein